MKISIQGFGGSYHHVVANSFDTSADLVTRASFPEVFSDVNNDIADFGVVAIENSIAGAILENFDRLRDSKCVVIGEKYLKIQHQLIALPGQQLSDIKEVHSHPMALKQVQAFLEANSQIKPVEADDTAGAVAQIMSEGKLGVAGVASKLAAELYAGEILAQNIETDLNNFTRFLLIAKPQRAEEVREKLRLTNLESQKLSVYIETDHQPGSLLKALHVLESFKANMTMLVSRPVVGQPWQYGFYIDFTDGKLDWIALENVLRLHTSKVQLLGQYQIGK